MAAIGDHKEGGIATYSAAGVVASPTLKLVEPSSSEVSQTKVLSVPGNQTGLLTALELLKSVVVPEAKSRMLK